MIERTVKGIVGEVKHGEIIHAWYTQKPFRFPGSSIWYVVTDYQYYFDRDGEHYEATIKEVQHGR